jgi:glycosyltransferase involved in cell wall biosynthesis
MSTLAAIILTYNEELHIERCIRSLQGVADEIFVVDSFSTDRTVELAKSMGVTVYENAWKNYATQFNWALKSCPLQSDWVWRMDADEYADTELGINVRKAIAEAGEQVTGIYVKRKIVFMGRPLMHGTWYPRWNLKIFRKGVGQCENRWMDEHIKLSHGDTIQVEGNQVDDNLNNLTWWTEKHNSYSTREMVDMLMTEYGTGAENTVVPQFFGTSEQRLRWLKTRYMKVPFFVRPFINFVYRYILRGGFRDGKQGLIWHFLQGFWYRFLVDAKIWELKKKIKDMPPDPLKGELSEHERMVEWLKSVNSR